MSSYRFAQYNDKKQVLILTEYEIEGRDRAKQVEDRLNKIRSEVERQRGIVWKAVSKGTSIKVLKQLCNVCRARTFSDKCYSCRKAEA